MANENKQNLKIIRNQPLLKTFGMLRKSQSQYNSNPSQFDFDLVPNCFCTLLTLSVEAGHVCPYPEYNYTVPLLISVLQVVWKNAIGMPIVI